MSDLLKVLTCIPEVPEKHVRPSTRAAALLNSTKFDLEREAADAEVRGHYADIRGHHACIMNLNCGIVIVLFRSFLTFLSEHFLQ